MDPSATLEKCFSFYMFISIRASGNNITSITLSPFYINLIETVDSSLGFWMIFMNTSNILFATSFTSYFNF